MILSALKFWLHFTHCTLKGGVLSLGPLVVLCSNVEVTYLGGGVNHILLPGRAWLHEPHSRCVTLFCGLQRAVMSCQEKSAMHQLKKETTKRRQVLKITLSMILTWASLSNTGDKHVTCSSHPKPTQSLFVCFHMLDWKNDVLHMMLPASTTCSPLSV